MTPPQQGRTRTQVDQPTAARSAKRKAALGGNSSPGCMAGNDSMAAAPFPQGRRGCSARHWVPVPAVSGRLAVIERGRRLVGPSLSLSTRSGPLSCGHEAEHLKLFDGYIAVDWSANGKPKQGNDSIWIASRGEGRTETPENPATRQAAVSRIEELLEKATAAGWRLLVGFDFPFGYPEGTARLMTGRAGWEAVWSRIAEVLEDDSRNKNNRFDAAALLNAAFVVDGPFWGNGLPRDIPGLPRKKPASGWGVNLPANLRHAESEVKSAQEVWKLNGVGSVGGQALTGIAALEGLRNRVDAQVWPFETLGEGRSHVLAEIYPSLIEPNPGPEVKDARQVDAVAVALQQLDKLGELKQHLRAPSQMPAAVCKEEGLILGMQDPAGFQRAARMAAGAGRSSATVRGSEVSTQVPQGIPRRSRGRK